MTWTVRDAVPEDAAALGRIRLVMLEALGHRLEDLGWMHAAEEQLREHLAAATMLGAVAETEGRVVSGGLARVWRQLPGPDDDGTRAWLFSVATEVPERRRGIGRAVVTHLVERLDRIGVRRVDLTASEDGVALYESLGFERTTYPLLRRPLPGA
jgi:ribosomal protein S18 acetylase RimI-like enzyme